MPPRTAGVSMKGLLHARPTAEDNGHGVDSVSPEVPLSCLFLGLDVEDCFFYKRESLGDATSTLDSLPPNPQCRRFVGLDVLIWSVARTAF